MQDITELTTALLRSALALDDPALSTAVTKEVQALYRRVDEDAQSRLAACVDANGVERALRFAVAAIEASLAAQALDAAQEWHAGGNAAAARVNSALARRQLLRAAASLDKPLVSTTALPRGGPVLALPQGAGVPAPRDSLVEPGVDVSAQRNIAAYHREHERFYTAYQTEAALDLYREANKLKVLAGVWLDAPGPDSRPNVDYAREPYHPVGCVDLNSRHAIGHIGVLYMEGLDETEPSELVVLKNKLRATAMGSVRAGQWLVDKMYGAWKREQQVFLTQSAELGEARLNTIASNWRGSRTVHLAGRVLWLGMELLARQDFSREGVRRDREAAARIALNAAWIIAMAGQLQATSGLEMAENDRSWTAFLEGLPTAAR
jgi:hypothetical protein